MRKHFKSLKCRRKIISFICVFTLSCISMIAQNITVSGLIFDNKTKEPLPGTTVVEKGSTNAVMTDVDGKYSITVPSNANLEFTSLGYEKVTLAVNGRTSLDVGLVSSIIELDEYVVVGYGVQKKVNMTGAVGMVNIDDKMSSRSISNVSSALSGLIPGLAVQQTSGMAGNNSASLLIRGLGSVNKTAPLIVVDGMPDIDINRIDMNDVSSISVLKDASSASVYGSRAANGVILITTKSGANAEKTQINYNGSYSFSKPTNFYNVFNNYAKALDWQQKTTAAGRNTSPFYTGTVDEWLSMGLIDPIRFPNTDQFDWVTRTGHISSHHISATGSSDKNNYYIGVGMMDEEGFMIRNDHKRYNFRANLDYRLRKDLRVGLRVDGQWTNTTFAYEDGLWDRNSGNNPLAVAITGITPYNYETNQYGGVMAYGEANNAMNLFADYDTRRNERERQEFNGNIYTEYEPIKGLTARVDFSLRYYNQFQKSYQTPTGVSLYNFQTGNAVQTFIPESAGISNRSDQGRKQLVQFKLQYQKEIIKNQDLSVMGVFAEEYWHERNFSASRNDRIHPIITEIDGALRTTQGTSGSLATEGLRSYVGRINYSAWSKYLLELSFRVDGSSRFLPGHQYSFLPSGSIGWRFSEESFYEPFKKYVSSGKLRLSYGTLGNNDVARTEQQDILLYTPYAINGNNLVHGFSYRKMINDDLSWEKTNILNIGLDLGFFDNRLNIEMDYYDRLTKGMLRPSDLSTFLSGISAPRFNMGNMRNKGIELNIRWENSINKFRYGASFNMAFNRNKLESYNERRDPSKIFIGMPYYFNYVMPSIGIAQTWEEILNAPYHNDNNLSPGDILYEDLNGDGQITGADKKAYPKISEHRPNTNYGLNLFAEWNGFDLNALFQAATGRKNYWLDVMYATNVADQRVAFLDEHLYNTWTLENRYSELPRVVGTNTSPSNAPGNRKESSYWLQSMDYLRLKNLQIGYNIPRKVLNKLTLSKCRIFVSAENLFTITGWDGVDPEKARYEDGTESKRDNPFPLMKSMSFGINVGF